MDIMSLGTYTINCTYQKHPPRSTLQPYPEARYRIRLRARTSKPQSNCEAPSEQKTAKFKTRSGPRGSTSNGCAYRYKLERSPEKKLQRNSIWPTRITV